MPENEVVRLRNALLKTCNAIDWWCDSVLAYDSGFTFQVFLDDWNTRYDLIIKIDERQVGRQGCLPGWYVTCKRNNEDRGTLSIMSDLPSVVRSILGMVLYDQARQVCPAIEAP